MSGALDQLLAALPLPALAVHADRRVSAANPAALSLVGRGILGRNFVNMLRQPALIDAVEEVLAGGASRTARFVTDDGAADSLHEVSISAVPQFRVVLLCFQDVTHLEQAGQMRRDFVANVSHELRTPLTALMGFIETLRGPARDDAAARDRFLDIMEGEAGRMNRLVGDLLSLSRVEGDERVRPRSPVTLQEVLDSVLRSLRPIAEDAGVKFETDFGPEAAVIPGDQDQLMQVFTNLVENALKYGASGGVVTVALKQVPHEPALRAPAVHVSVADLGPGIDPMHLPRLTERFYRADSHRSRALGGTGLGLAIVKHIINRHRGRLKIDSAPGRGSTFTVILPSDA